MKHPPRHRRPLIESLELRQLLSTVTVHPARAPESAGQLTFHVKLDAPADHPVTLTYATRPGTATPNADYTPTPGTLTLPAGKTESTITVPVANDDLYERRETLFLDLHTTNAKDHLAHPSVKGTITNDDAAPTITLHNAHTREGDTGRQHTVTLTAKLSAPAGTPITLSYTTSDDSPYLGAATAGVDYAPAAGRITFLPGQTSQTFPVLVTGDASHESPETVHVSLSHTNGLPAAASSSFTITPSIVTLVPSTPVATSTLTIRNDDKPSPSDAPLLSALAGLTIDENAPSPSLTVTLSKPSSKPVTFHYTAAEAPEPSTPGLFLAEFINDAPRGSNFTPSTGTLTIPPGQTSATIPLSLLNDSVHQPDDSIRVSLSHVKGATLPNARPAASTHVTLTDSDPLNFGNLASSSYIFARDPYLQIQAPATFTASQANAMITAWPTDPGLIATTGGILQPITGSYTATLQGATLNTGSGAGTYTLTTPSYYTTVGGMEMSAPTTGSLTLSGSTASGAVMAFANPNLPTLTLPSTMSDGMIKSGTITLAASGSAHVFLANSNPLRLSTLAPLDLPSSTLLVFNTTPDAVRALLLSAFNAGTWTAPNVPATPASADPAHRTALAYAPFSAGPTAPTSVLIKPALYGDANLDGTVDSADTALLEHSLSDPSTPPSWSAGDFNYDSHINADDLSLLDRNMGHSLP